MTFDAAVEVWRALVDEIKFDDQPTDALLAWIAEESGGNPCAVGIVEHGRNVEAGIGQQYFESPTGDVGGVTAAELRAPCGVDPHNSRALRELTDEEKIDQVSALVTDAAQSVTRAQAQLLRWTLVWTQPEQWCLAKLQHGLPAIPALLLGPARAAGQAGSWRAWWAWIDSLAPADILRLAPAVMRFGEHKQSDGAYVWVGLDRFRTNAELVGCAVGALP